MQKDRLVVFMFLSLGFYLMWAAFIMPMVMPPKAKETAAPAQQVAVPNDPALPDNGKPEVPADAVGAKAVEAVAPAAINPAQESKLPNHPHQQVVIGDLDRNSRKFRMQLTLDSQGAAVSQIEFSDHKYREGSPPYAPLKLLVTTPLPTRTLDSGIPAIDAELEKLAAGVNSQTIDWEIVPDSKTDSTVAFRLRSPEGKIEAIKRYELQQIPTDNPSEDGAAYGVKFTVTLRNLSATPQSLSYRLTGPVGLVIENPFYTREYQNLVVGFDAGEGAVTAKTLRVDEVIKLAENPNATKEQWKQPLKYVGVGVQYFTALLIPVEPQRTTSYLASTSPELVLKDKKEPNHSQISVSMTSTDVELPAATKETPTEISHQYLLYAGPKRPEYLRPLGAEGVIQYGMSGGLGITQFMHWYLNFLHGLFPAWAWPWGWAIILLTVTVRLGMLPLSMKQARSAARMQELQPELAALKKKYATDKEKFAREQWGLFRRNKVNPLGGCLPLLIQFPIFIGLYQALSISVDLRMAEFLWMKNLAAPDALMQFPWVIQGIPFPIFGKVLALGPTFNLLPLLTVGLFLIQQKLFMPPAMDDEQRMQQKMMTYMMVFMGLMFYGVPAGLCVYFISSSVWSIVERKSLPKVTRSSTAVPQPEEPTTANGSKAAASAKGTLVPAKSGAIARLLNWADNVSKQSNTSSNLSKGKKKD